MHQAELTDPAEELIGLVQAIQAFPESPDTVLSVFSSNLGLSITSPEFLEFFAIVRRRLFEAHTFALNLEALPRPSRDALAKHINQIAMLFNPTLLNHEFKNIRDQAFQFDPIPTLGLFSRSARDAKPLKKLSSDDIEDMKAEIDIYLAKLSADAEVPIWARSAMADGLNRLRMRLTFLPYFGVEVILDELLHMRTTTEAVIRELISSPSPSNRVVNAVMSGLAIVVTFGNLFILPDQGFQAFERYRSWIAAITHEVGKPQSALPPPETKQLPVEDEEQERV